MPAAETAPAMSLPAAPALIAIRREPEGYGIRFGLSEAEDAAQPGPVFATLAEAMAWVEHIDGARRG